MGETHVNEETSLTELMQSNEANHEKKESIDRLKNMRKKTDLSDIILEKETSTANRNKKIILGAASLVLLFLVFLIISKMINSDVSTEQVTNTEKTENKNINIEDKAIKEPIKVAETSTKNEKSSEVKDTDLKFEEMVKKLREEDAKENSNEVVKVVTPPKSHEPKIVEPVKTTKTSINNVKIVKTNKPQNKPKVIITEAKKDTPTKIVKPKEQKPKRDVIFGQSHGGYYVQVGATTSPTLNKNLVNKITINGYSYKTHPVIIKGKKFYKVLIGPYNSKAEAIKKLPRIRATLNPKAFLYHLR
jgi:DedD protein